MDNIEFRDYLKKELSLDNSFIDDLTDFIFNDLSYVVYNDDKLNYLIESLKNSLIEEFSKLKTVNSNEVYVYVLNYVYNFLKETKTDGMSDLKHFALNNFDLIKTKRLNNKISKNEAIKIFDIIKKQSDFDYKSYSNLFKNYNDVKDINKLRLKDDYYEFLLSSIAYMFYDIYKDKDLEDINLYDEYVSMFDDNSRFLIDSLIGDRNGINKTIKKVLGNVYDIVLNK